MSQSIRNIAIIAHVDHGKTTLVDALFRQGGVVAAHQSFGERAMDRGDLERERGLTILAKCTAVFWKGIKINIVDTPGHADFGAEVERILSMVDGVLILVDSVEGVMPQTKFVVQKAMNAGLPAILVINKIDRADARCEDVHLEALELLSVLGASPEQLDCPVLYASGRSGWAIKNLEDERTDLAPLFDTIVETFKDAAGKDEEPFRMLVSLLEVDAHLGRLLVGRVDSGTLEPGDVLTSWDPIEGKIEQSRVTKLFTFQGISRIAQEKLVSGDIVAVAGLSKSSVGHTLATGSEIPTMRNVTVDPPTLSIWISINDSPLGGREGDKLTSGHIRARLLKEMESNVALQLKESDTKDAFEVFGRGELQLGVLIETMRREGFELSVACPQVVFRKGENGQLEEPLEEVQVDVDDAYAGVVIEKLGFRKGELQDMRPSGGDRTRLLFHAPSRGLIGYQQVMLTDTRGSGIMNRRFHGYVPHMGPIEKRVTGDLVSMEDGVITAYALRDLEARGVLFVVPTEPVYAGMIIGEHNKENDLDVNACRAKQLSNVRAAGKDERFVQIPPRILKLEEAIANIGEDALLEVTPSSLRLRKKILIASMRKRSGR